MSGLIWFEMRRPSYGRTCVKGYVGAYQYAVGSTANVSHRMEFVSFCRVNCKLRSIGSTLQVDRIIGSPELICSAVGNKTSINYYHEYRRNLAKRALCKNGRGTASGIFITSEIEGKLVEHYRNVRGDGHSGPDVGLVLAYLESVPRIDGLYIALIAAFAGCGRTEVVALISLALAMDGKAKILFPAPANTRSMSTSSEWPA